MGWAARANDAVEVRPYLVRRWTGFTWEGEKDEVMRKVRENHLQRTAELLTRKLVQLADGRVKQVRVEGVPQLLFELTVSGCDEQDAIRRAVYRVERTLQTRIPSGLGRRVRLVPPWGKSEAEAI